MQELQFCTINLKKIYSLASKILDIYNGPPKILKFALWSLEFLNFFNLHPIKVSGSIRELLFSLKVLKNYSLVPGLFGIYNLAPKNLKIKLWPMAFLHF